MMAMTLLYISFCIVEVVSLNSSQSCVNGLEVEGSRTRFWSSSRSPGIPVLADIFSQNRMMHAVFNMKENVCDMCWRQDWEKQIWRCTFDDDGEEALTPVRDPHGLTLIITCNLRSSEAVSQDSRHPLYVSISAFNSTTHVTTDFNDLTFCNNPIERLDSTIFKYHLGACTSIIGSHLYRVPEWVMYHIQQGWEHFFIYVNDDASEARRHLAPLITAGIVDIIDFEWPPPADFAYQQAAENSCLFRYQGVARWVAVMDVDEFFQPIQHTTMLTFLHKYNAVNSPKISSLRFDSYRFGSRNASVIDMPGSNSKPLLTTFAKLCVAEFVFRAPVNDSSHIKSIVQPHHLFYFSAHIVTLGLPFIEVDRLHGARIAHYKTPRSSVYDVLDTSMCEAATYVRKGLVSYGFGNISIPENAWSDSWIH